MIIRSHIRLTMITDTIVHSIRTCAIVSFMIAMAVAFFYILLLLITAICRCGYYNVMW